ncbi:unnamed protein product [Amaranthus hypochondriacus]
MMILNWWGIKGVFHSQCELFVPSWSGLWIGRRGKKLWNLILSCVIWSLWYERNRAKFEALSPGFQKFAYSLRIRVGIWAKEILEVVGFSPLDLATNMEDFFRKSTVGVNGVIDVLFALFFCFSILSFWW